VISIDCLDSNSSCDTHVQSQKLSMSKSMFKSYWIIDASTIKCTELSTAQAGASGREGCCTFALFIMYRHNQTESAILL
jgi:hypothetical protein